jgi:hypothetical protein
MMFETVLVWRGVLHGFKQVMSSMLEITDDNQGLLMSPSRHGVEVISKRQRGNTILNYLLDMKRSA